MIIPVVVPVKAHVQKFIINRYGDGKSHAMPVRKLTFLGDMLSLALVKHTFMQTNFSPPAGCFLIFYVSSETKFMEVPSEKMKLLQAAFERNFRDCLISFVTGYHYGTGNQMQAVKKFLESHQISEDEMSSDTAWKIWRDFEVKMERIRTNNFRKVVGAIPKHVGKIENSSVVFGMS
ncbi:hypothetical protein [Spirosoma rigui]|uniref:hypothetical protein n=1 Tax=Spirosoma rigui TaxID=564064 RepID=UPI0009B09317|nr:hypothetical protein [Spirosoma rigui]